MITQHRNGEVIIPASEIDGAFFDLDGTLTDNTAHHLEAWRQFAAMHDQPFTDQWFHDNCIGKTSRQILTLLFRTDLSPDDQSRFFDQRFVIYKDIFRQHGKEISGLTYFLHQLKKAGVKVALVTSGSPPTRKLQLAKLELTNMFHHVVGSEHVTNTKPHPEPYDQAREHFGLAPERCLAFEDSQPGVESAARAGMHVISVMRHFPQAVATIPDYTQIRVGP